MKKLDKKYPPVYGTISLENFNKIVDSKSFPVCESCDNPIYNPLFYEGGGNTGMCGPCTTGEADSIMWHEEEVDDRYDSDEFKNEYNN